MKRSTIGRITVAVVAVLGTTSAMAQGVASDPFSTPPASSQPVIRSEDFDRDPIRGWHYSCEHQFVANEDGRALVTQGGGHGIWASAGRLTDFTLRFHYAYEQGDGDVFFRATETPAGMEFYCVTLEPTRITLGRRLHAPGQEFPENDLAVAPCVLRPYAWYEVAIVASGGLIEVWIGGQQVIRCQDPHPLTAGQCGLGVIAGSGSVLYDNVSLNAAP